MSEVIKEEDLFTPIISDGESLSIEVINNFNALLIDVDLKPELELFHISLFNRTLRRTMFEELRMVYIGLWYLALTHSFPQNVDDFFETFLMQYLDKFPTSQRIIIQNKIHDYKDMILRAGTKDFNHISQHLLSFVRIKDKDMKAEVLRLSLALRTHYNFIFQHLV